LAERFLPQSGLSSHRRKAARIHSVKQLQNREGEKFTFVRKSMEALYPVLAHVTVVFPPISIHGTVRIDLQGSKSFVWTIIP
jgi:hypothetical protein